MATSSPSDGEGVRLQILGHLRLWRDGVELDAGPPQQAYLLALLLVRAGRPISTNELIDLIWGDDVPASAVNILQKYAGSLRRLLEPALPARGTGVYLQRRGNGYVFLPEPGMLDAVTFRELVEAARAHVAKEQPSLALDCFTRALGLWQGPAGDGMAHGAAAMAVFATVDGEFFEACVAAAELAVTQDRPELVLPALLRAAAMAPLDEKVQAALVTTLGAAGQQAQALSVFRTVRARLAEELGIDPGPALLAAHQRLLGRPSAPATPADPAAPADLLVGRGEELTWPATSAGSGRPPTSSSPGGPRTPRASSSTGPAGWRAACSRRARPPPTRSYAPTASTSGACTSGPSATSMPRTGT